jgi:hypothetical protein
MEQTEMQEAEKLLLEEGRARLDAGANLSIAQVCALAGVCPASFFNHLRDGRVRVVKIGRRTFVPTTAALNYIHGKQPETAAFLETS